MKIPLVYYSPEDNLAYFPIFKNANTYFKRYFSQRGWKSIPPEKLNKDVICFCHIRNPKERFIKGLTQVFESHGFSDEYKDRLGSNVIFLRIFHDQHLIPISEWLEGYMDRMKFIVMDHPKYTCNEITNIFLEQHNIEKKVPLDGISRKSALRVLEIQDLIREQLLTDKGKEIYSIFIRPKYQIDIDMYDKAYRKIK